MSLINTGPPLSLGLPFPIVGGLSGTEGEQNRYGRKKNWEQNNSTFRRQVIRERVKNKRMRKFLLAILDGSDLEEITPDRSDLCYSLEYSDHDQKNSVQVDILQFTVIENKPHSLKHLLDYLEEKDSDLRNELLEKKAEEAKIGGQTLLHLAAQFSSSCLNILLNTDGVAKRLLEKDDKNRTVFHLSAANKKSTSFRLLFRAYSAKNGKGVMVKDKYGNTPLHYSVKLGSLETTFFILESIEPNYIDEMNNGEEIDVDGQTQDKNQVGNDNGKQTALFYARDIKTMYLLLEYGADPTVGNDGIVTMDSKHKYPKTLLHKFLDNNKEMAQALLNYELEYKDHNEMKKREYIYNLRLLCTEKLDDKKSDQNDDEMGGVSNDNEMGVVSKFIELHQKPMLTHPIPETLIHLKWLKMRKLFFLNVFFYFMYIASLSTLICWTSYERNHLGNFSTIDHSDFGYGGFLIVPWKIGLWRFIHILSTFATLYVATREIIQLATSKEKLAYFKSLENWIEIVSVLCSILYLLLEIFPLVNYQDIETAFGAISLFLGWNEMTMLLGRHPSIGIYTYMSVQVLKQLFRFFTVYMTTLIAFALTFNVLLPKSPVFENPITSFLKVVVMMIGEFDFNDSFTWDAVQIDGTPMSNFLTQVVFVFLIFLVSIVIANLIIGLTVYDTDKFHKVVEIFRLGKTVEQITSIENSSGLFKYFTSVRKKFENFFEIKPLNLKTIHVKPFEDDYNEFASFRTKQFCIYKQDEKKLDNMQLPIWVIERTDVALEERRVILDDLYKELDAISGKSENARFDSVQTDNDGDAYASGSFRNSVTNSRRLSMPRTYHSFKEEDSESEKDDHSSWSSERTSQHNIYDFVHEEAIYDTVTEA